MAWKPEKEFHKDWGYKNEGQLEKQQGSSC